MGDAAASVSKVRSNEFGGKYHFLLRRLHSLTGVIPVGVFVIFHLFTNAQMIWAKLGMADKFQHEVEWIHSLPALLFLEIFGLWLPIAFHAALGLVYTFKNVKPNAKDYPYWDNWRYTLQRVSGIIALLFIAAHILTLRGRFNIFGWYTPFFVNAEVNGEVVPLATYSTAMALQASWLVVLVYIVGVLSVIYHWSNGLWTAAITWGVTISAKAQQRWAWACGGLFAVLFIFSAIAIWSAATYTPPEGSLEPEAYQRAVEALQADEPGVWNVHK